MRDKNFKIETQGKTFVRCDFNGNWSAQWPKLQKLAFHETALVTMAEFYRSPEEPGDARITRITKKEYTAFDGDE